jgi:positive regulator of sigma E activity
MVDGLLNFPLPGMALMVFLATYLVAGGVHWIVMRLAATEWGSAFKAVSPAMLSPLGILFALLIGFIAVEVWSSFDKAKAAVAAEASALRSVVLLARNFPPDQRSRLYGLINRHVEVAVNEEWPEMAEQRATLLLLPTSLIEALQDALSMKAADDRERTAQPEIVRALEAALDARRQRIVISESAVGGVKWVGILLQGLCTLVVIAMVHADNRRACAISLTTFATGIALSVLLIAAYSRPFTGANSVGPQLLKQVIASESGPTGTTSRPTD